MDPTWSKSLPITEKQMSERFELVWTRPLKLFIALSLKLFMASESMKNICKVW